MHLRIVLEVVAPKITANFPASMHVGLHITKSPKLIYHLLLGTQACTVKGLCGNTQHFTAALQPLQDLSEFISQINK
jgi:hypothetical protein